MQRWSLRHRLISIRPVYGLAIKEYWRSGHGLPQKAYTIKYMNSPGTTRDDQQACATQNTARTPDQAGECSAGPYVAAYYIGAALLLIFVIVGIILHRRSRKPKK